MSAVARARLAALLAVVLLIVASHSSAANAQSCPASVEPGQAVQCTIAAPAEVDTYTLAAQAGDRLLIRAASSAGLQLRLRLRAGDGTALGEVASYGAVAELPVINILDSGTYTLLVEDRAGTRTGAYAVSVQRLNAPAQAEPLAFGPTVSGALLTPGAIGSFTLSGAEGDQLLLRASTGAAGFNPQLRLFASDGSLVCGAFSYGRTVEPAQNCLIPADGVYTMLVTEWREGRSGSYHVVAQRLNAPMETTPLSPGVTVSGSLASPAALGFGTVDAAAGDTLLIRLGRGSGSIQPHIRLYGPDGTVICGSYSYGIVTEKNNCLLPQTGRYLVVVADLNEGRTGAYGMLVQRLNEPGSTLPIARGVAASEQLSLPAELDSYTFTGSAGETVLARMAGLPALSPVLAVYGPNGLLICSGYSYGVAAETSTCLLPSDGRYTLMAGDFDDARTGGYSLHLQSVTAPGEALPVRFGSVTAGRVTTPGAFATYTLQGNAGAKLRIRASATTAGLNPAVRLYGPDGLQVCTASSFGSSVETGECLLATDGQYTLLVTDYSQADTGDFSLLVSCLVDLCGPAAPEERLYLPSLQQ